MAVGPVSGANIASLYVANRPQTMCGGPRPINSLSRGIAATGRTSVSNRLNTTFTTGDNVPCSTLELGSDLSHQAGSNRKRRRLNSDYNSQSSPYMVDNDDEDDLNLDIVAIRHISQKSDPLIRNTKKLETTQKDPRPDYASHFVQIEIPEYNNIEKLMNSNPKKARKSKRGIYHGSQSVHNGSNTPMSSAASIKSDSLELLDDEDRQKSRTKPSDQDTVMFSPSGKHFNSTDAQSGRPGLGSGESSPHFLPAKQPKSTFEVNRGTNQARAGKIDQENDPRENLGDQFRDIHGQKRGVMDPISSDELAAPDITVKGALPAKPAPPKSPLKMSWSNDNAAASFEEDVQPGLAQSNIRPAEFTIRDHTKKVLKSSQYSKNRPQETPPQWGVSLTSYILQGERHRGNLGLVFDDNMGTYDVIQDGKSVAQEHAELRLWPEKLLKIQWASSGGSIRFHSSRSGTVDNVLDVEVSSEREAGELVKRLRKPTIKFERMHKEVIDRLIEHRLSEQSRDLRRTRTSAIDHAEDERRDRVDIKRLQKQDPPRIAKRRRLVDSLTDEKTLEKESQDLRDPLVNDATVECDAADVAPPASTFRGQDVLSALDDKLKDKVSKYTLRNRNESSTVASVPDGHSPHFYGFPQEQRYSKIHGLGRRWAKPLTYPSQGKKRTTVEWDDLERLDEGEFLNDNLISFYMRWLEFEAEKVKPAVSRQIYLFNSFFYERLTSSGPTRRGINYEAVRKWTRGVDIFTYDYVVVPVNESAHWYVAVICNLPALNRQLAALDLDLSSPQDEAQDFRGKEPSAPLDVPKRVGEDDAAASFAEMRLDSDGIKTVDDVSLGCASPTRQPPDIGQRRLDYQPPEPVHDRSSNKTPEPQHIDDGKVDASETETQRLTKAKKQKRLPPLRTFDPDRPTIITFDSFGTAHPAAIRILKQYLHEEASDKRGEMGFEDKELQGVTAKNIPQQDNFCDCGVFLLGYMEKFFENPREFITKVMRREWDIKTDWPRLDPSAMRSNIRDLISRLHEEQCKEKKDAAFKAGKFKRRPKASAGPSNLQAGLEPKARADLKDDATSATFMDSSNPTLMDADTKVSRNSAPSNDQVAHQTRNSALASAWRIDEPDSEDRLNKAPGPTVVSAKETTSDVKYQKPRTNRPKSPLIVIESQSQPIHSNPTVEHVEDAESLAISPELPFRMPVTVPDSQPLLDSQTQDIPASPPPLPKRRAESKSAPTSPKRVATAAPNVTSPGRRSNRLSTLSRSSPARKQPDSHEIITLDD